MLIIAEPVEKTLVFNQVYRVLSVKSVSRSQINATQAGVAVSKVKHGNYWLFELGEALTLSSKITSGKINGFRAALKLTTLSSIHQTKNFDQLTPIYSDLLKSP